MMRSFGPSQMLLALYFIFFSGLSVRAQKITTEGQPAQLDISRAGEHSIRITLKPLSSKEAYPFSPGISENFINAKPGISLQSITTPVTKKVGALIVKVSSNPLTVAVTNSKGQPIQKIVF